MRIQFSKTKDFKTEQLEALFLSVDWSSGKYPDKLKVAMKNSHNVFSAWDGGKLVGLLNCLSDGIMNVYIQYLLVQPEYQGNGIGKELINQMLTEYKDYARKTLLAYDKQVGFYENCGFNKGKGITPMNITFLTT